MKTINEAFEYVIQNLEEGTPLKVSMSLMMIQSIQQNLADGKNLNDEINF